MELINLKSDISSVLIKHCVTAAGGGLWQSCSTVVVASANDSFKFSEKGQ